VSAQPREPLIKFVRKLGRPVFTTREVSALAGKSLSVTTQGLRYLAEQGILIKVRRGLWAEAEHVFIWRSNLINARDSMSCRSPKIAVEMNCMAISSLVPVSCFFD
jgi:Transcriptional regulator, AbiEi antitoxin